MRLKQCSQLARPEAAVAKGADSNAITVNDLRRFGHGSEYLTLSGTARWLAFKIQ